MSTKNHKYRQESHPVNKPSRIMLYIVIILMSSMIAYLIFYRVFQYETMTIKDDESPLNYGDRVFIRFYDTSGQAAVSEEYHYLRVDEHDQLVGDLITQLGGYMEVASLCILVQVIMHSNLGYHGH